MKKFINIIQLLGILGLVFFVSSCEDEDKSPFLRITNPASDAAVLRTIEIQSALRPGGTANANGGSYQFSNLDESFFNLELEYQDAQNGELLDNVEVTLSFEDLDPVPFVTLTPADFTRDDVTNLLRTTLSLTATRAEELMGLNRATDVEKGDAYRLELVLNLTNGQVFNSVNLEGNVTGPFFNSPFTYEIPIGPQPFGGDKKGEFTSEAANSQYDLAAGESSADGSDSGDIAFVAPSGFEAIAGSGIEFVQLLNDDSSPVLGEPLFDSYSDVEQAKIDFDAGTKVTSAQLEENEIYIYSVERDGETTYGTFVVTDISTDDDTGVVTFKMISKEGTLL